MQYRVYVNGKPFDVVIERQNGAGTVRQPADTAPARAYAAPVVAAPPMPVPTADERIVSPLPGNVWQIPVSVGQAVSSGQCLIVLEAMKMENEIVAPRAGTVKQVLVSKGAAVNTDDVLIVLG